MNIADDEDPKVQKIIAEEVLRERIRALVPSTTPKPSKAGLSANPLIQILLGFILTGVLGSSLTYYYTNQQKQNESVRQLHEKELDAQRSVEATKLEFERRKTLMDLENRQHINAQELEANRIEQQKKIDFDRAQVNVIEDRKIAQAKTLDGFMKYINSEDPLERTFGYDMFVRLGQGELAARLISFKGDPAGRTALLDIQKNNSVSNSNVQQIAKVGLSKINDVQLQRILAVTAVFETGKKQWKQNDIKNAASVPSVYLKQIQAYLKDPRAEKKQLLNKYLPRLVANDIDLRHDTAFISLLEQLSNDPVMDEIAGKQFNEQYLIPAIKKADELGVTTVLGIAAIFDVAVNLGAGRIAQYAAQANTKSAGSPTSGLDEKTWMRTFIEIWLERGVAAAANNSMLRLWPIRAKFFLSQVEKGNWDLLPPYNVNGLVIN